VQETWHSSEPGRGAWAGGPWILRGVALAVILAALIWLMVWRPADRMVHVTGGTMGTTYSVRCVVDPASTRDGTFRRALAEAIETTLAEVDRRMSTYRPDSELSRLNAHADTDPVPISLELLHVLRRALAISEATGGAFDVTVGPLVNAYGFGPEPRPTTLPSDAQIEVLRQRVGYRMIRLDLRAGTVAKQRPDLYLDLSAIAKGYAVDQVAAVLDARGIHDYMVEVGGEVRVKGRRGRGKLWRIGVEKPTPRGRGIYRVLELTDTALATSGDYRNYYDHDGRRISHTIDPRTGRPITHALASVTVLAADCESADAWATALMVLGPKEGYNLAEKNAVAAMFLIREAPGVFMEKSTSVFKATIASMRANERISQGHDDSRTATTAAP